MALVCFFGTYSVVRLLRVENTPSGKNEIALSDNDVKQNENNNKIGRHKREQLEISNSLFCICNLSHAAFWLYKFFRAST